MSDSKSEEKVISEETPEIEELQVDVSGNAKIVAKYDGQSPALSCAVFPEGKLVAVGWSNGSIEVRDTETFEKQNILERSNDLPTTFLSGCTSSDERHILLASYASGDTSIWDVVEGQEMWSVKEDRQSLVNDFSYDHNRFAVGGSDAKINVYDTEEQKLVQVLQGSMDPDIMDGHTMRVFAVRFHPTRKHELVSGGWDDTIQFWDVREPFSRRKIRGPHICGAGIEFYDNKIITASWTKRNPLQMWDYGSGKLIQNIKPDDLTCFLYFCRYVESESVLLTGGSDKNIVKVIDANTFKTIVTFRNLQGAVYFAKDLPKSDSYSYIMNICFCSNSSIYKAEIEV